MNSEILFRGDYGREDIDSKFRRVSSRKIDIVIEGKANEVWQQKVEDATESGKKIWDQLVYRLENFQANGDKCRLDFSTIPFSIRSSLKDFMNDLVEKGASYLPMAVYTSIFIETAEGKFVFGEKSDKYAANRKYTYIGGVFNRNEEDGDDMDLFASAQNEIEEELNIKAQDIEKIRLIGAFRSKSGNVGLVFYCKLGLTESEVVSLFNKRTDFELSNLFFVKREDLREVCVNKIGKEVEMVEIFEGNNYAPN